MALQHTLLALMLFLLGSYPWTETLALPIVLGDELVTIGQNFTGLTSTESPNQIPPDTMGAVGSKAFVELINGGYAVYDKGSGALVQSSTLNQFWRSAGADPKGTTFDPRVVYDPFSARYYASSADQAQPSNNVLLAVSNSSDPTQGWTGFSIKSDPAQQRSADFPTLGFNQQGVYVSANMFPPNSDQATTSALAVPKVDLLAAVPTVVGATLFSNTGTGVFTQPAVDLDNKRSSATLLSSNFGGTDRLLRSDIVGSISAPSLISRSAEIAISPVSAIFNVVQPPPGLHLDQQSGTALQSNVVIQNNSVWGVQTVRDNAQAALRWFQADLSSNRVLQEGLIQKPGLNFFYGSIAVNKAGDVVIGFTGSGPSQFASAYAVAGITRGGITAFGDPMLLRQGVASYQINGVNRWGDYSATTLDPSNSKFFWTIQEWAAGMSSWATQITEIRFGEVVTAPEPSTLLLIGPSVLGLAGWQRWGRTQKL